MQWTEDRCIIIIYLRRFYTIVTSWVKYFRRSTPLNNINGCTSNRYISVSLFTNVYLYICLCLNLVNISLWTQYNSLFKLSMIEDDTIFESIAEMTILGWRDAILAKCSLMSSSYFTFCFTNNDFYFESMIHVIPTSSRLVVKYRTIWFNFLIQYLCKNYNWTAYLLRLWSWRSNMFWH